MLSIADECSFLPFSYLEPSIFNGEGQNYCFRAKEFLERYENMAQFLNWTDQIKVNLLFCYLTDTASKWHTILKSQFGDNLTWDLLVQKFKRTFIGNLQFYYEEKKLTIGYRILMRTLIFM